VRMKWRLYDELIKKKLFDKIGANLQMSAAHTATRDWRPFPPRRC